MKRALVVAGTMLAMAATEAPANAQAPGCSLAATAGTVTRTVDGRTYLLNVPSGLSGPAAPLLVSIHGFSGNAQAQESFTGWTQTAVEKKFIVAYPQGRPSEYGGAWDPYTANSPDVAHLRAIVADIKSAYCVDSARVYADGWSNGAVMSQRLACSAADLFSAVSSYGGGGPTAAGFATGCSPSRPISIALLAGQYDFTYASLAQNTQEWRTINACGATPTRTTDAFGSTETYSCAAGTKVLSRTVANTSHNWPSGAQGADQRERIWSFFTG